MMTELSLKNNNNLIPSKPVKILIMFLKVKLQSDSVTISVRGTA